VCFHPSLFPDYNKNKITGKDKNAPIKKKGANGIYFCLCLMFQMYANMHENIIAKDNPIVPSQTPPAPNNFMSPIPIGGYWSFFFSFSNIKPTINPIQYPVAPPTTESEIVTGHGKNVAVINPANKNGNKYTSGIILRLKSVVAIRQAQKSAPINIIEKNI
jgi:hypothetical protein